MSFFRCLQVSLHRTVLMFPQTVIADIDLDQLSFSKTVVCLHDGAWSRLACGKKQLDLKETNKDLDLFGESVFLHQIRVVHIYPKKKGTVHQ